jgi:hypothetical protein
MPHPSQQLLLGLELQVPAVIIIPWQARLVAARAA